jgi:hypothetical protein
MVLLSGNERNMNVENRPLAVEIEGNFAAWEG